MSLVLNLTFVAVLVILAVVGNYTRNQSWFFLGGLLSFVLTLYVLFGVHNGQWLWWLIAAILFFVVYTRRNKPASNRR